MPILTGLREDNAERLVGILEAHLLEALRIEVTARGSDFPLTTWWRSAVESSNQNSPYDFKDTLLDHLRDTLVYWAGKGSSSFLKVITRYLDGQELILRRLGLYIIRCRPDLLPGHVTRELLNASNYQDVAIHHEFMCLLEDSFPRITTSEQQHVLAIILNGPPHDLLTQLAERAHQAYGTDTDEYIHRSTGHWILQRLWLIRGSLDKSASDVLKQWVTELGEPDHPTFLSWTSGVYSVSHVSPLSAEHLAAYSPRELVAFLAQWEPDTHTLPGPQQISREGLATTLAGILVQYIAHYQSVIVELCSIHPQYTFTLFRQVTERAKGHHMTADEWQLYIQLADSLLEIDDIRTGMERVSLVGWQDVRNSIVDLLKVSLDEAHIDQVQPCLSRVRGLLITLLADPDPCLEMDQPPQGWSGHDDPITVALNHVRPKALDCLIRYARLIAVRSQTDTQEQGPGPDRLELIVKQALEFSLHDPSQSVRSVFGRYLNLLYWLDRTWVHAHLTDMFPQGETETDVMMFVAAWEAYVIYNNPPYRDLMVMLSYCYEQAIRLLKSGYTSKTRLHSVEGLAVHLIRDYFWRTAANNGVVQSDTLLHLFFDQLDSEYRGKAAWLIVQYCKIQNDSNAPHNEFWPAARAFWQCRVDKASSQSFPSDFDQEMSAFARLLAVAPAEETILSLWPLLQGTLPYVAGQGVRHTAWKAMEKFLSSAVAYDPVRSIELYTQMHERTPHVLWGVDDKAMQTIIEQAAQKPKSRKQALALMDLLARRGDLRFQPLYERYA